MCTDDTISKAERTSVAVVRIAGSRKVRGQAGPGGRNADPVYRSGADRRRPVGGPVRLIGAAAFGVLSLTAI
jgi:hypothetical protein